MKVRVKKRFIFKRANVKAMFGFKAPLWSGPGSENGRCAIERFEHSPLEAFFAQVHEETLLDWARCCGHATVRELLQKELKHRPWVFKAHEPEPAPKRAVHYTSGSLQGALDGVYEYYGLGGSEGK